MPRRCSLAGLAAALPLLSSMRPHVGGDAHSNPSKLVRGEGEQEACKDSYNRSIRSLCQGGDVDAAMALLPWMDSSVYSRVIRLYRDNGMWKKAVEILVEMWEASIRPDRSIYNGVIDNFGKYGQMNEMVGEFESMQRDGIALDIVTWNSLIRWHCKWGDLDRALRFLGAMQEKCLYPDPNVFLRIINRLGENGMWEKIRSVFEGMRCRGLHQSGIRYAVLADIYG